MSKFVIIGDVHIADVTPASRVDDYKEAICKKLEFIAQHCRDNQVRSAFLLGDLFHIKAPSRNSHGLIVRLIEILKSFGCPVYTILGNHDWYKSRELIEEQPITVLQRAGALTIIADRSYVLFEENSRVAFTGLEYLQEREGDPEMYVIGSPGNIDVHVILCHQMLLPPGESFISAYTTIDQVADFVDADVVVSGHYHPGYNPVVQPHYGRLWANPGCLARNSMEEHNLTRQPCFLELSVTDRTSLQAIQVPCEPAEEIFNKKRISGNNTRRDFDLEAVASKLTREHQVDTTSIESIMALVKSITPEGPVHYEAMCLLEEAEREMK